MKVVYITAYRSLEPFKVALESCAAIGQFYFNKNHGGVRDKSILSLHMNPDQQSIYAVKEIVHILKTTDSDVLVDADALQNALALFNVGSYRKSWGVTDEMVKRIYEVVYDPKAPHRAEILQGITEALRLQDLYSRMPEVHEKGN